MFNFLKQEPKDWFTSVKTFTLNNWVSFDYPGGFVETREKDSDETVLYQFHLADADKGPVIQVSEFTNILFDLKNEKNKLEKIFGISCYQVDLNDNKFIISHGEQEGRTVYYLVFGKNTNKIFITVILPFVGKQKESDDFIYSFLKSVKMN